MSACTLRCSRVLQSLSRILRELDPGVPFRLRSQYGNMPHKCELRLPALEIHQGPKRILYSFAVDGKLLPTFATISRVRRGEEERRLQGYQRPEVLSHISEIRRYLES